MSRKELFQHRNCTLAIVVAVSTLALLAGCSVKEDHTESGEKKVDITTPFGRINVNTDVNAQDTGLPVYPGAQRIMKSGDEHDAANVNVSVAGIGVKVVAIKYRTDDPPQKVLDFYRSKMKEFGGQFLECKGGGFTTYERSKDEMEIHCDAGGHGDSMELKAGTPDREHIVSVKPSGSGSEFAIVYVQKRGEQTM